MTIIKKESVVPYTASQMYDLICTIENYPEILSWCKKATVLNRNMSAITANLHGFKMGIPFAFTMVYQLAAPRSIDLHLMHTGPFKHIKGVWRFAAIETGGCRFSFELQFEFKNRLLAWTVTPVIRSEINHLIQEFRQRAQTLYG